MKIYNMKNILSAIILVISLLHAPQIIAHGKTTVEKKSLEKPYNPNDNAQQSINQLVSKAKKEKKYVILQAGGNWCSWCLLFNDFTKTNKKVKSYLKDNYLYYRKE